MSLTSNGFADTPQFDMNANKPVIMENSLDDTMKNDYEPGHATEMLTNSVLNLKIENDAKDFKAHAGKILTGMLESRLNNEKNLQNGQHKIQSNLNKSKINDNNNKNVHDTNGNSIHNGKPTFRSFNSAAVPKLSPNSDAANIVAMPLIIPTSPCTEFPPPPSPSELNDYIDFPNENHNHISIIGQTKFNEHEQDKQSNFSNKTIDGFSAKLSPIQSNDHQANHQQPYDNDHTNNVIFRNKNTKPELTTHARDRRSYIEKDNANGNSNRFLNHNNNLITSHVTEIATGLRDGKHPVCSVCHIKITR